MKYRVPCIVYRLPGWSTGLLFCLLVGTVAAWACPSCKEALFDPAQAEQVARAAKGYAWSIGLLVGTPMLLVGTLATVITRQIRRSRVVSNKESELTP